MSNSRRKHAIVSIQAIFKIRFFCFSWMKKSISCPVVGFLPEHRPTQACTHQTTVFIFFQGLGTDSNEAASMPVKYTLQQLDMTAHGIGPHERICGVDQLQDPQPFFFDKINRFLLQFVICQSPALDPDAFISRPEIAIETLFLANAGDVDGGNHEDLSSVAFLFKLARAAKDCLIKFAACAIGFAPEKRREVRSSQETK